MPNIPLATANGDPSDHLLHSGIVEAWNAAARGHQRSGGDGKVAEYAELVRQLTVVKVKNNSGANRSRGHVLGINGPLHNPATSTAHNRSFERQVEIDGVTPTIGNHFGRFVILLESIRDGAIGLAALAGVCPALVASVDSSHGFADVGNANGLLSAESGAAQILWHPGGSGVQPAIVRLGPPIPTAINELHGQLCGAMEAGDFSADVTSLSIAGSTDTAPSIGSARNILNLSGNAGDIVILRRLGGSASLWYINNVEHHQACMVNKVWDSPTGLAVGGVNISAMYGQAPSEGCLVFEWNDDCDSGSGSGSGSAEDLSFSIVVDCCGTHADVGNNQCGSGSGSGGG